MDNVYYVQTDNCCSIRKQPHSLFMVGATLDPYAGCDAACLYCPFGGSAKVGIKTNFLHSIEQTLRRVNAGLHLGLGAAGEPYCAAEKEFSQTRTTLELVMKYGFPLQIFTKSDLIRRDIPLLKAYSEKGLLAVSISVFSLDRTLSSIFEAGSVEPEKRIEVLRDLCKADIFAGVVLAPVIPLLSDAPGMLEEIFAKVKNAGGEYILPSVLRLENTVVRGRVMKAVQESFPDRYERFVDIYRENGDKPHFSYLEDLSARLQELSRQYHLPLSVPTHAGETAHHGVMHELLI